MHQAKIPGPILITGASGGIGRHLTDYLLSNGVRNLICHHRTPSDALTAVLKKHDLDPAKHSFGADLTKESEVERLKSSVQLAYGTPWGVLNLAGASTNSISWKLALSDFQKIVEANLLSTFLVTKAFLPGMRERQSGRIVNISSIVGHSGVPGASHYCAAKAGIEGLTRAIALEVANKKITVNSIALGYFEYGLIESVPPEQVEAIRAQIPAGRLGKAEDLGSLLMYLMGDQSGFLTGQILHLNGGQRL